MHTSENIADMPESAFHSSSEIAGLTAALSFIVSQLPLLLLSEVDLQQNRLLNTVINSSLKLTFYSGFLSLLVKHPHCRLHANEVTTRHARSNLSHAQMYQCAVFIGLFGFLALQKLLVAADPRHDLMQSVAHQQELKQAVSNLASKALGILTLYLTQTLMLLPFGLSPSCRLSSSPLAFFRRFGEAVAHCARPTR